MNPSDQLIEEIASAIFARIANPHTQRGVAEAVLRSPSIQALVEAARQAQDEIGMAKAMLNEVATDPEAWLDMAERRLAEATAPFEAVPEEAAK